jgi:hypothetical protein
VPPRFPIQANSHGAATLVPPLALLGATHPVGVVARGRTSSFASWASMVIASVVVCAFWLWTIPSLMRTGVSGHAGAVRWTDCAWLESIPSWRHATKIETGAEVAPAEQDNLENAVQHRNLEFDQSKDPNIDRVMKRSPAWIDCFDLRGARSSSALLTRRPAQGNMVGS